VSDTYKIACECDNCGHSGEAEFPKGTPVPALFVCPNCGCQTARKKPATVYRSLSDRALSPNVYGPIQTSPPITDVPNLDSVRVWCKADEETK